MIYTFAKDIVLLLNYTGIMNWIAIVGSAAALLYLRKTKPDLPRPIKVPIVLPIVFIIILTCLIIASVVVAPVEAGWLVRDFQEWEY